MYFIFILVLMYSVSRYQNITSLGVSDNCPWWNYLTFHICHITFFHLLVNSVIFYLYWQILKKVTNPKILFIISLFSSTWAAVFSKSEIPTVGASAIIYSMIATLCIAFQVMPFKISRKEKIKYYALIGISLVFPILINSHSINYKMHLIAFTTSLTLCYIFRKPLYAGKK